MPGLPGPMQFLITFAADCFVNDVHGNRDTFFNLFFLNSRWDGAFGRSRLAFFVFLNHCGSYLNALKDGECVEHVTDARRLFLF